MMCSFKLKLCVFVSVFLTLNIKAEDYATFESFYSSGGLGVWEWTFIILGSLAIAAVTFFSFGGGAAAAPAWIATVGGWIGSTVGLSGVAAANFGLALLGGGTIAAGGLGVAGGVAALSAAASLGIDVAISYSTDIALEKWNYSEFIEASKNMNTLPLPRNENGGSAYQNCIEYINEHYTKSRPISDPVNQNILKKSYNILIKRSAIEEDKDYLIKDHTLAALILFQTNDFIGAKKQSRYAISLAISENEDESLPQFIWALSYLSCSEDCNDAIIDALARSYLSEPDNKLIPIMTACCMDRLMYKYHHGKVSIQALSDFLNIITNDKIDEELAASSLNIFVMRCLIELKRTNQDIYIVSKDKYLMRESKIVDELKNRFERNSKLISLIDSQGLLKSKYFDDEIPPSSPVKYNKLHNLISKHKEDAVGVESYLQRFSNRDSKKSFWDDVKEFFISF